MKRHIFFLVAALFLVAQITGCGGNSRMAKGYENPTLDGAPDWVFLPSTVGPNSAVGSAPAGPGGFEFQRSEAMAVARMNLALKLAADIRAETSLQAEGSTKASQQKFEKFFGTGMNQKTDQILVGTEAEELWIAKDGTLFILVGLDPEKQEDTIRDLRRIVESNGLDSRDQHDGTSSPLVPETRL